MFGNRISTAVAVYLGYGLATSPRRDKIALEQRFGAARAEVLVGELEALLAEAVGLAANLQNDLAIAGRAVGAEMKRRRPKLTKKAASAPAWYATFNWR